MTLSLLKRIKRQARRAAAVSVLALGVSSCGSGGSDGSPPTVRPKTLDGINMILDNNVTFEFVRNTGTSPALYSGDVETGTFFYNLGGVQLRQYPNFDGDYSDARYPDFVSNASYSYRAVNETSGVLTLSGVGVNDLVTTGSYNALNGSFTFFFNSGSDFIVNNLVEIDITFSSTGTYISSDVVTVRIPGSGEPGFDTVRIPSKVALVGGGSVPENYNPTIDVLRPSKIAPESLNGLVFECINGIPDPFLDFTIQFVADANGIPPGGNNPVDEIGQGLLRVAGAVVDDAVNYTWTRIGGTDDGILTISGSNSTFDGKYTLKFAGTDNGAYIGQVDGDTLDAAEVTGTFSIPRLP